MVSTILMLQTDQHTVWVCVLVAVSDVAEVVDVRVEIPVSGDVVETVGLHHEVHNMLDL